MTSEADLALSALNKFDDMKRVMHNAQWFGAFSKMKLMIVKICMMMFNF